MHDEYKAQFPKMAEEIEPNRALNMTTVVVNVVVTGELTAEGFFFSFVTIKDL